MSPSISALYSQIPSVQTPAGISSSVMQFCQTPEFFPLASHKQLRNEALKAFFRGRRLRKVFIGGDINRFEAESMPWQVGALTPEFFNVEDAALRRSRKESLEGAVVILNNNDIARARASGGYQDFFAGCDKTIFVAWDWDNHHWLENSTFVAAHSDLYCPAHHENLYLLSRYNWQIAGPVYCASIQWSRSFLSGRIQHIVGTQRSNDPLGKHVPYAMFNFRNSVIATLSAQFPTVGFSDQTFHARTPEDRLLEWCAHKVHWIMPVLNDVAIRIFDALITGGIPLVPASMKLLPLIREIPEEYILFFSPGDVVSPHGLVARALKRFDEGGVDKIIERHRYALGHHHGEARISSILELVRREFGF